MAKTRLTNADRDNIREAVIHHKFAPIEANLLAEEHALAIKARIKAYGDFLAVMEGAPKGAFVEESQVRVNVGGRKIYLNFGGEVRVFAKDGRYDGYLLSAPETDALGAKILDHAIREEQSKQDKNKLRANVKGTLAAFTTFDDLLAGWPEADKFITARWRTRPDYSANVPAVAIRDLSTALDLPPEVEEAA